MRTWGKKSQKVYDELDERLQRVVTRVRDEVCVISLLEGFRDERRQQFMFMSNRSHVQWPDGKHNKKPSLAVDLQPYPFSKRKEKQWAQLAYMAAHAIRIGIEEGIIIRWGGDWNQNGDLTDQKFDDLFHLEIVSAETEIPTSAGRDSDAFRLRD